MILSSFKYKVSGWELVELNTLGATNLLVGKNASGKTRTIKALRNVTSFLSMRPILFAEKDFKVTLVFSNPEDMNWEMKYMFEVTNGRIVTEQLAVCKKRILKRDTTKTVFNGETINPPSDKLVVQVRRDREAFPEFEQIMEWAEGVVAVSCSDINPFTIFNGSSGFINPLSFSGLVDSLTKEEIKSVIKNAKQLGYDVVTMDLIKPNNDVKMVMLQERYVNDVIMDFQLSSGMLRVLYILCFLKYIKHTTNCSMLLLDDLGEGLDYSRATLLGNIVFDSCEDANIQMVASSNDSFLMDVVDISKWQILRRKYTKLTVLNHRNNPELFDSFRMTGLSNFDLFSSDYIDNYLERSGK